MDANSKRINDMARSLNFKIERLKVSVEKLTEVLEVSPNTIRTYKNADWLNARVETIVALYRFLELLEEGKGC